MPMFLPKSPTILTYCRTTILISFVVLWMGSNIASSLGGIKGSVCSVGRGINGTSFTSHLLHQINYSAYLKDKIERHSGNDKLW